MAYRSVVFDLDGTLIDTIPLILASHRHALQMVLGRSLPDDVLRAGIGIPLGDQMRRFDEGRADDLYAEYRRFNHANTAAYLTWFDGVDDMLRRLAADGVRLAVATSKSRDAIELAFALKPPAVEFDAVVALDDTTEHKPGPAPVLLALARTGTDPADAAYVGDAVYDLVAARAAGCAAVAVSWGAASRAELTEAGADAIAATAPELYAILRANGRPGPVS